MNKKLFVIFIVSILFFSILSISASADMGPKPSITIIVENPPEELYYLDLLVYEKGECENISDKQNYNQNMLNVLETYNDNGWRPGLAFGTGIPMWGNLKGVLLENGSMKHEYAYYGVPDDFKLIFVTSDLKVKISVEMQKNVYQMTITYDYETGEFLKSQSIFISYLRQFASTFFPTLILEGIILMLFSFSLKKNWYPLLYVNLITQIVLTALLGTAIIKYGSLTSYMVFIPLEIFIIFFETIIYAKVLKGHTINRKILYSIVANALTVIMTILYIQSDFIKFN